jgi:hypothetical protein
MGCACSTHGSDEKCIQNFSLETCSGIVDFGEKGVDGRMILKWILKK